MIKILITGGSGFIGRNLVEELQTGDGYFVAAPSSSELNLLNESTVEEYLRNNRFDLVIHAATWNATRNSPKDTSKVLDHNLRMFLNLARCKGLFGRFVYFGSGAEFSRPHWRPKMREDYFDAHVPTDQYGFSKYIMTKYTQCHEGIYNLRLFGVFGKYEDWEIRFISNAICKTLWDLPITIKQNTAFDYLYIEDLIKICKWFIHNDPSQKVYNVCSGQVHELISLAEMVREASGKDVEIKVARPGLGTEYSGDNSRLVKELGGFSFTPIRSAIKRLYEWYEKNRDKISPDLLLFDK